MEKTKRIAMISSELFNEPYQQTLKDYEDYINRNLGD